MTEAPSRGVAKDVSEQIVVVSDIHLGEDLAERGPASLQEYVSRLNEEFVRFLEWLSAQRQSEPIALVINGDMFDFVKISLRPNPREAYMRWRQGLSPREERMGLDNTPEHVVWKLERILENHRPLFFRLAQFIGEGNRLQIVAGNHDREFYYPEVMAALRAQLADLYFGAKEVGDERPAFMERVQFSMWFHLTEGGVYIEHGHQYDPYCSFEYLLAPLKRDGEIRVALPLTHRAIPYFADLLGDMSTHNLDTRGFVDWLKQVASAGPRLMFRGLWAYARAVVAVLSEAGPKGMRMRKSLADKHSEERRVVAERYGLAEDTVRALDSLHATPAEFSFFKMVQAFYVDRFAISIGALTLVGLEAWILPSALSRVVAMGATLAGWLAGSTYLARTRKLDTRQLLRDGASNVYKLLHPKLIVFGHSHKPEVIGGATGAYINIGSWISRAALLGDAPWGMTFAWIHPPAKPTGLYRWLGTQRDVALVEAASENAVAS